VFENVPDWVVAECVLPWLVARTPVTPLAAPRVWQIRSVISFGGVCRRLRGVVRGARAVWAVDIGHAIDELARGSDDKDEAAAAALRVLRCVPRPVLAVCGAFSFLLPWFVFPMSFLLAFVLVMPALTRLRLPVSERPSDIPSADLVGLVPADVAEWRGRG
jgi:hypothetical protein